MPLARNRRKREKAPLRLAFSLSLYHLPGSMYPPDLCFLLSCPSARILSHLLVCIQAVSDFSLFRFD